MGFKGTMRSLSAAQRRYAREQARQERQRVKFAAQEEKERAYQEALFEVQDYEDHVAFLVSFHKQGREAVNWGEITAGGEPEKPIAAQFSANEDRAKRKLQDYKPGRMDKVLRREGKIRQELEEQLEAAKQLDDEEFQVAWEEYLSKKEAYDLAQGINVGDPAVYLETLYIASDGIQGLDTKFAVSDDLKIVIDMDVSDDSVIPSETKTLLKSGKLSVKKMPVTKYWQLYQDYVCSLAIRIAREVIALVPTEFVLVNVRTSMLNTKTGHKEMSPILSVAVPSKTLTALNMEMIDPSDAMANFVHRMKFAARSGFKPVDPLVLQDFET